METDSAYKALVPNILGAKYARLEDESSVIMIIRQAYEVRYSINKSYSNV